MSPSSTQKDAKKKSTSLPSSTVEYLKTWMMSPEHIAHPYPTEKEKSQIMADTGIELKQLTNWFVNNRKRYWKPRVEARLKQQTQVPNVAAITSHQTNCNTNAVSFKMGLFPPQADNSISQQKVPNEFVSNIIRSGQPNMSPGAQSAVNSMQQINSADNDAFKIESHCIQGLISHNGDYVTESFPNLKKEQFISSPFTMPIESCNDQNAQVISTGSTSSFSDCDSTSISNASHDESQEPIITLHQHSPNDRYLGMGIQNRQLSQNELTMIIGQAIAHSLCASIAGGAVTEPMHKQTNIDSLNIPKLTHQKPSLSLKRARLVSDFDSASCPSPITIIARPRSLSSNNNIKDGKASFPKKRRFVECSKRDGWQNACRNASHGYDSALPTLEEAAQIFGFSSKN